MEFNKNQAFHIPGESGRNKRRETMRRKLRKHQNKRDVVKVMTGMLLGSVFGAAVALLMAPASGEEMRRKIAGETAGVREKIKSAAGNVESRVRELREDMSDRTTGSGTRYPA
ncbi:MAG TPA: YtxH domain-containing protein [Anaerolineales bacterium]